MQSTLNRGLTLLFKTAVLALIVLGFIEITYRVITACYARNAFTAALVDKHAYAKSIASPKIVLVGGSNLAFGINSEKLGKMTGMPVVNMALLAPLGIDFILSDATGYINKGDIVVMSFEYDVFPKGDVESQLSAMDFVPENGQFVTYKEGLTEKWRAQFLHRLQAPLSVELILQNPTVEDPYSIYFRKAFTRQGDIISHLNNITRTVNAGPNTTTLFPYEGQAESMNAFTGRFRQKGAEAFFLYPTIAESFYKNSAVAIGKLDERYQQHLKAAILSRPEESVYADSLCFDTVYHLKAAARDAHTEKVAGALLRHSKSLIQVN